MATRTQRTLTRTGADVAAIGLLSVSFLWAGMILDVSFLATPAKFLAPSIPLPVALDVGRQTFAIFTWVEIGWSLALVGLVLVHAPTRWVLGTLDVPFGSVRPEPAWLFPILDARGQTIISGSH